ncbi:zinc finger protein RFP-like isoform X1 [Struthio camelus]|uniref:zinc finger protein RFP-like isoform X1 n=1 Tax=Struthio camelus TaxID=8801 RepID=UPI003603D29E
MSAQGLRRSLEQEVTCPICLGDFEEPVMTACGHNFCRGCVQQERGLSGAPFPCPLCREPVRASSLRPNLQLGTVAQLVQRLALQQSGAPGQASACQAHGEALRLFCREDEALICVICREARAHRAHAVLPLEEAAQEYEEELARVAQGLREHRTELQQAQAHGAAEAAQLLGRLGRERRLVAAACEELRRALAEEEQALLGRLAELDGEVTRRREQHAAGLSARMADLSALMAELEETRRQPAARLLQDARSAMSRAKKGIAAAPRLRVSDVQESIQAFPQEKTTLQSLVGFLGLRRAAACAVDVTLDPATAHPNLILSGDRKSVRHGDRRQELPDNPERFSVCVCVLGREQFTGGRHYWEVHVEDHLDWDLGVCRESVKRKVNVKLSQENGYWAVYLRGGIYKVSTSPPATLPVTTAPERVGILLDYEAGVVSFYNLTDRSHLFTFTSSFSETLRPYFSPSIIKRWQNRAPLTICPIPTQP